ncbi:Phosphoribosylformimino-5-aminoimidazole carboxamide ribotide isomerase [Lachnospiraceae bacterium TWA4]|nr:Phosphoribosylformimino-5-aminoimidazole carboxamide ribotide isomerase [Lachnospiraceae bacterium TWA4]
MQIYPTIEIKDGQCKGIRQSLSDKMELTSPVEMARYCLHQGSQIIHLIDLDGAIAGHSVNIGILKQIAYEIPIPLQLCGGIRTLQEIEYVLNCGISRVVLGAEAIKSPRFVKEAIKAFSAKKIVVSISIKDHLVCSYHEHNISSYSPLEFCKKMEDMGLKTMIVREKSDYFGFEYAKLITEKTNLNVIISSDISSLKELELIKQEGIYGVILNRALREHRVDLRRVIQMFS